MMKQRTTAALALTVLVFTTAGIVPCAYAACGSCLGSLALAGSGLGPISSGGGTTGSAAVHQHHHHHVSKGIGVAGKKPVISKSALGFLATRHILTESVWGIALKTRFLASAEGSSENDAASSSSQSIKDAESKNSASSAGGEGDALEDMFGDDNYETPEQRGVDPEYLARAKAGDAAVTAGMTGAIGFYKGWISPLLPPACRFVPTCSQYGVQAIQEFGPTKGALLTAWRLMRCSPFGGRGYDPPRWPPVKFTYGSY